MLIGIISDTHDNLPAIEKAVKTFNEKGVDLVLHAGDYISPFAVEKLKDLNCEVKGVFGNNDGERDGIKDKFSSIGEIRDPPFELEVGGKKVILSHKSPEIGPDKKVDLVVHGHTHEINIEKNNDSVLINPGECSGWLTGDKTIAVMDLDNFEAEIIEL